MQLSKAISVQESYMKSSAFVSLAQSPVAFAKKTEALKIFVLTTFRLSQCKVIPGALNSKYTVLIKQAPVKSGAKVISNQMNQAGKRLARRAA